jgi:hypothetical protein
VSTMIDRVHQEPSSIQCLRKAAIAFTMFGQAVGYLHHACGLAGDIGPGVGDDLRAICGGDESGGRGAHHSMITRRRPVVTRNPTADTVREAHRKPSTTDFGLATCAQALSDRRDAPS